MAIDRSIGARPFALAISAVVVTLLASAGRADSATPSYTITQLGLQGPEYYFQTPDSSGASNFGQTLTPTGNVLGYVKRWKNLNSPFDEGQDAWVYMPGVGTRLVGLTGPGYDGADTTGGTYRYSKPLQINRAGGAIGYTSRYGTSKSNALGQDAWGFDANMTRQIGLTGDGYEYSIATNQYGVARWSTPVALDEIGRVIGNSNRYNATGGQIGQDAWIFDNAGTRTIGLMGDGYEYTSPSTAGGTVRWSEAVQFTMGGQVVGYSSRTNGPTASAGRDIWAFDGTTRAIGLIGPDYQYVTTNGIGATWRDNELQFTGLAGEPVTGYANRYNASGTSLGQDAWVYDSIAARQVGLTGPGYEYAYTGTGGGTFRYTSTLLADRAGHVLGSSSRYNAAGASLGYDAWVYTPNAATRVVGLTGEGYEVASTSPGGGMIRRGSPAKVNASGQVAGTSTRYNASGNSLGQDAWFDDGSATRPIGLTGPEYEYASLQPGGGAYRQPSITALSDAGMVLGSATRYSPSGAQRGQDAWVYNGVSTTRAGLTGPGYEYTTTNGGGGTYRTNTADAMNAGGDVIGVATRYANSSLGDGQTAWFYDGQTGETIPLAVSIDAANGYGSSIPHVLTDGGEVLGSYERYAGSTDLGAWAFLWSEAGGLQDLGALVNGGLDAAGWQSLVNAYAVTDPSQDPPATILGAGLLNGQTFASTPFVLKESSPTPEPAGSALLAVGGLAAMGRRRRKPMATV